MKIVLTGVTGFIGSAFLRLALDRGHQVAGLMRPGKSPPLAAAASQQLVWMTGTLSDAPWKVIQSFQPEVCVHTAWVTAPGSYLEAPENHQFVEWSRSFMRKICLAGAKRVVTLGTCIEYKIGPEPLSEERTPLAPMSTYARCKNALRLALEEDALRLGFVSSWTRVFYPYGPGEHPSKLCTTLLQTIRRNDRVILKTPNSTKDYIYIEDLAAALLTVVENDVCGCINLGTGVGVSVRQIARTIANLTGKPELVEEATAAGEDPYSHVVADVTRLRSLGWEPKYDLEAGLKKFLATA